jgi:hypothetical protein
MTNVALYYRPDPMDPNTVISREPCPEDVEALLANTLLYYLKKHNPFIKEVYAVNVRLDVDIMIEEPLLAAIPEFVLKEEKDNDE